MFSPFERTSMGSIPLSNRLILAPVKTGYGSPGGEVTQRFVDFYVRRARGGVGLIIPEPMYIHPSGKELPNQIGIHNDALIDGLRRLTDAIHEAGGRVAAHLNHAGRMANRAATGLPLVSSSVVACPRTGHLPEALTGGAIASFVDLYRRAARRAQRAGCDAIELQFGHGYLIAQFLSLLVNRRTDEYGGTLENRMRFGLEVLAAVRAEVGPDLPIICRLSAKEYVPQGLTLEESREIAAALERGGAQALHVSGGTACESPAWYFQHSALPERDFLEDAKTLKTAVNIPVIAVGRLGTPDNVREALKKFGVDFVALGRPLVADPDFPLKMQTGHENDICPCGACLQGCLAMVRAGKGLSCVINPVAGREGEVTVRRAERRKRVMIIGGGPAGLEAGTVAAARGHRVDLFEGDELGGQLRLASVPPAKKGMAVIHGYLLAQAQRRNLSVHLGSRIALMDILNQHPDVVVVATGAEPIQPHIRGLEKIECASAHDVVAGRRNVGQRALVVGGGMVGMETAELLAFRGKEVTVVEILDEIARDMESVTRALLMKRIQDLPVAIMTGTRLRSFEEDTVVIERNGRKERLPKFDTVIFAVGSKSMDELSEPLRQRGFEVHTIGDALKPRTILDAVHEGFEAGRRI